MVKCCNISIKTGEKIRLYTLSNIVLEALASLIKQVKEIRSTSMGEKEVKLPLITSGIIVHKENTTASTKQLVN